MGGASTKTVLRCMPLGMCTGTKVVVSNAAARALQADALEQLGYQSENATWRNAYLTGAQELRNGVAAAASKGGSADDLVRAGNITLVDVRPADERAIAAVGVPFKSFDGNGRAQLEALPKDTALAFMCHHGGRSAQAAEQFRALGFTKVFNVTGGIDAWSTDVDPNVARY